MTVLALSGGVGGAKLALGLANILPAEDLLIVANTGDDFEHLGLSISPDLDTLMYALAGLDNQTLGWGRRDETWSFMDTLASIGGETWFRLGDRDLAVHIERTRRRAGGESLTDVTAAFWRALGIGPRGIPMTDDKVRTKVLAETGWIDFQDYFVGQQCRPVVRALEFHGADQARPHPALLAALTDPTLEAVVICPSNPFISIEPILALPGVREALRTCNAPIIAVSPIIAGQAVKGPTAKMMTELGMIPSSAAVAARYADFLDTIIIDSGDADEVDIIDCRVLLAPTLMKTLDDKIALARIVLDAART